jgi:hypothetical protein
VDAHTLENARAFAKGKWKNENAELVDQPVLQHRVRELANAVLQQAVAW